MPTFIKLRACCSFFYQTTPNSITYFINHNNNFHNKKYFSIKKIIFIYWKCKDHTGSGYHMCGWGTLRLYKYETTDFISINVFVFCLAKSLFIIFPYNNILSWFGERWMLCLIGWSYFLCFESVSWLFIDQQMNLESFGKTCRFYSSVF